MSPVAYLTASNDPLLQAVVIHQHYLFMPGQVQHSAGDKAGRRTALTGVALTNRGLLHDDAVIRPCRAVGMLKNAQYNTLRERLGRRTIMESFSSSVSQMIGLSRVATSGYRRGN